MQKCLKLVKWKKAKSVNAAVNSDHACNVIESFFYMSSVKNDLAKKKQFCLFSSGTG